ncbi:MAG TPA: NAD-dependent epimerase/dehydratase family protein [Bacteroidota bacterium]|nr:NAD-dependent epimerase/dehydratase family protein [Bacteroidota bacterium]
MSTPSSGVIDCMGRLKGGVLVLGGSGKMGPELTEMMVRADAAAGTRRDVTVASSFRNPADGARERFEEIGVRVFKGDLTDPEFLESLPPAENVMYMPGFKFGSSANWEKAVHVNCILPYLVGEIFRESRIVVFSSTNPYAAVPVRTAGSKESDALDPRGIYGWSIVARESAFAVTAGRHPGQRSCFFRLTYAQHLAYGVIVDLVRLIIAGKEISVAVPYVNLVSQRDANERAVRAFEICANPPAILNVSGPPLAVRDLARKLGAMVGRAPVLVGEEPDRCQIVDDGFCVRRFGQYHDSLDDIMAAAVRWVRDGGEYWGKPTNFGEAKREY